MATIRNTGSGSWQSASTWNTGTVPGLVDNVDIIGVNGAASVVELSGTGAVHDLRITAELDLVGGTLGVGGSSSKHGGVVAVPGVLHLDGTSQLTAAQLITDGLVQDDGLIVLRGFASGGRALDNRSDGTINVTGELRDFGGFHNAKNALFVTTGHADFSAPTTAKGISLPATTNDGTIEALDNGLIQFHGALFGNGTLIADHGEIDIFGLAREGGGARLVGEQSTLKLLGGGSLNVEFVGISDQLFLGRSLQYKGSIAGFAQGDKIDVLDQAFNASLDKYNPNTHTLQVGSTTIKIVGTYTASDFTFASDGHGGTLIGHV